MVVDLPSAWHVSSSTKTHVGKVRTCNEDSVLDLANARVWVVADGMGGHSAGDVASQWVVDTVRACISNAAEVTPSLLTQALQKANKEIYDYSQKNLHGKVMGAAVVLLFIKDNRYVGLWAGDCRLYLHREQCLTQCTRDHSQVMQMVEEGLMNADEAEAHPMANIITRAVGVFPDLDVDMVSGTLQQGDQLLLCSDGLTNELNREELILGLEAETVTRSSMALLHSALVKGAKDNVSLSVVKVTINEPRKPMFHGDQTIPLMQTARGE